MTPPPLLLLLLLLLLFPMAIPRYFFLIALSLSLSATAPVASSSSTADTDLRSKSLILVKIGCLILLFVGTFAAAVSPYFLKWNEAFLLLGTQFAGGVFLGAALMHFLRDANHTFEGITSAHYPFAFMLASAGYLLTMLADCVISYVYAKQSPPAGDLELQGDGQHKNNSHNNTLHSSSQVQPTNATVRSFGDTILLISALCFHSFFEGMAIGVAETKSNAWKTLWTICLHKIFAAVAMGIALLRMTPNRPLFSCVAYGFAFAISSPVGVAVGITIDATAQGAVADWIFAISMGLTCGIFIFISINHLISKGYVPSKQVSVDTAHHKLLAVLLGVGTISVVLIWDT